MKLFFPIVSFYLFVMNTLPRPTGEIAYMYILKKRTNIKGPKSFASLVVVAIMDGLVLLLAMLIVGLHLRTALSIGLSSFVASSRRGIDSLIETAAEKMPLLMVGLFAIGILTIVLTLYRRRFVQHNRSARYLKYAKSKILEMFGELSNTSLDKDLLIVAACSVSILLIRLAAYWRLLSSMGIDIGVWQLGFAQFFSTLFSIVPIVHGPAGLAPWVVALCAVDISSKDAITSGFALQIIFFFCTAILGLFSAAYLRFARADSLG